MSHGPTFIIDRQMSCHQMSPHSPSWWNSSGRNSIMTVGGTGMSPPLGLDVDSDDEEQHHQHQHQQGLLQRSSSSIYTPTNSTASFSSTSHLLPPLVGGPLTPCSSYSSLRRSSSYGAMRKRNGTAVIPAASAVPTLSRQLPNNSIRFQVVVWDVGPVDVALGRVPMTFRVTMFWDDVQDPPPPTETTELTAVAAAADEHDEVQDDVDNGKQKRKISSISTASNTTTTTTTTTRTHTEWVMQGRRKAYEKQVRDECILSSVDVPPVSLLNVVTFDVVGSAEVCVLRERPTRAGGRRRLMRWTCLYQATLLQDNMRLDNFPHDEHTLRLKLGVLVHRRPGGRWDAAEYPLALATEYDSQHSTRIPHGLIVDHVRVPNFSYCPKDGLDFAFVPHSYGGALPPSPGPGGKLYQASADNCLEVRLKVTRDSGYYDKNIMPLIGLLNVVAVAIPISLESTYFFQRGLMLLNITFVQIGIRMNVDKHLPSVCYQIKMQRIMNQFFFSLLFLVLESALAYVMSDRWGWKVQLVHHMDTIVASGSFCHIILTCVCYYTDLNKAQMRLRRNDKTRRTVKKLSV